VLVLVLVLVLLLLLLLLYINKLFFLKKKNVFTTIRRLLLQ